MPLPTAVCVGPMKTSTSWLYRKLRMHPELWLPRIKEFQILDILDFSVDDPHFDQWVGYRRKLEYLHAVTARYMDEDKFDRAALEDLQRAVRLALPERFDFAWYDSFFDDAPADRPIVEIAPTYAHAPDETVKRYAEHIGTSAKIIFILRNPTDRWLSVGSFVLKRVVDKTPEEETYNLIAGGMTRDWRKFGGYAEYIATWERHFTDVSFVYYDDLHAPGAPGLEAVCATLGVTFDPAVFGDLSERINAGADWIPPVDLKRYIAMMRSDEFDYLAYRFGGRAAAWRDEAAALT